jgi:ankyrin repeat protein
MIDLLSQYSRDIWHLTFMGKVERMRELLRNNPALARAATPSGETLLMWLPDDEHRALELTELLLSNGADATARDQKGMTAEDWARRRALDAAAERLRAAIRSRD